MTLYELLTLRPAYDLSDRLKLIEQVKSEEPTRPRSIDGHIPRDLETIVLKAIDKDPEGRCATAETMSEDLRRFLADEPIKARQVSTSECYWRWARRNPAIAKLGAVLTAVLVATTVGSIAAAAYFKEAARRESDLARSELLANQQSQRDETRAEDAQRQAVLERPLASALGEPVARQGLRLGRGGPRRPGPALDARGPQDRPGRRGRIPDDGPLEPGGVARAGPHAAPIHRYRKSVRLDGPPSARTAGRSPRFRSLSLSPSRGPSTSGTPPRGRGSARCRVRSARSPTDRTVRSS